MTSQTASNDPRSAAKNEYLRAAVTTATPVKIVVLLYDGALRALARAEHAIGTGGTAVASTALGQAHAIVGELQASLDFEQGGDIAKNLFALYGFVCDRILKAGASRSIEPISEARTVLIRLKEGWDGVVRGG